MPISDSPGNQSRLRVRARKAMRVETLFEESDSAMLVGGYDSPIDSFARLARNS